jgi:hypothetical protein
VSGDGVQWECDLFWDKYLNNVELRFLKMDGEGSKCIILHEKASEIL